MSSLLINIKIDDESRFEDFKITFMDIAQIFDNAYVKFRGEFAEKCLLFIEDNYQGTICSYQDIQSYDWIESLLVMIGEVKDRSVFIYLEDHRIVSGNNLPEVIAEFDLCRLDYLTYTLFDTSKLNCSNILPLSPIYYSNFDAFKTTQKNKQILSLISPSFLYFLIVSPI